MGRSAKARYRRRRRKRERMSWYQAMVIIMPDGRREQIVGVGVPDLLAEVRRILANEAQPSPDSRANTTPVDDGKAGA